MGSDLAMGEGNRMVLAQQDQEIRRLWRTIRHLNEEKAELHAQVALLTKMFSDTSALSKRALRLINAAHENATRLHTQIDAIIATEREKTDAG